MGAFDDLIPANTGPAIDASAAPANAFADLIPGKPAAAPPIDVTPAAEGGPAKITVRPDQAQAAAAPSKGVMGYADDAVRALAQGATFGFADEIAARANSLPLVGNGKTYEENLAAEKARNEAIPGAIKIPGEIAGAVGTTLATAPVTGAAAVATGAARLPGIVRAIGAGAGAGALFGAGNADPGLENRVGGAVEGAGVGALAGGVLHPVISTAAAVGRGIVNAVSPRAQVAADLGRALRRDNMTPADLATGAAEAQAVRPGVATLADAGGENVRGLVERVAQTPGAGRTQVIPALTERQGQQAARLTMDLASLTGTRRSALEATNETMAARAAAARPAYDEAMNFNAREVPDIVRAFEETTATGYGRQVLRSKEFRNNLQTEYGITDPTDAPLMVVIDAFKKAANDLESSAARGGSNNSARVVKGMTDKLVAKVDEYNPAYAAARDAWAGPTQYLEAIEQGSQLARPSIGADQVRATLSGMTAAQREAYVTGALSSVFRRMGNDPARMADMTKYLRSPEMRAKVEAIMPTPEAAQAWRQRLDFEVGASELSSRALGNSRTAVRQAEQDQADGIAMDLILDATAGAGTVSLLRKAVTFIPRHVRDTIRSRSDRVLADVLTNPTAASSADLQRLLAAAQQQMRPRSITSTVAPANAATAATEAP